MDFESITEQSSEIMYEHGYSGAVKLLNLIITILIQDDARIAREKNTASYPAGQRARDLAYQQARFSAAQEALRSCFHSRVHFGAGEQTIHTAVEEKSEEPITIANTASGCDKVGMHEVALFSMGQAGVKPSDGKGNRGNARKYGGAKKDD